MEGIQSIMEAEKCEFRGCKGELKQESFHWQKGTESTARKKVCKKNSKHCYFLVGGRKPSKYNRMFHK